MLFFGKEVGSIRKHIKQCAVFLAVFVILSSWVPLTASAAGTVTYEQYADALNVLELFRGTENGYELDRTATRAEALTLLIRLLGKENEALTGNYSHPFDDGGWADAYIGYAYSTGLARGVSESSFGSTKPITAGQYAAFLLRALGYRDGEHFDYAHAYEFALGKMDAEGYDGEFTRGELARLSYAALNTVMCGSTKTLAKKLIDEMLFTNSELRTAKLTASGGEIKTAVLIYAVASDLESKLGKLSADIAEIMDADIGQTEILVQAGGTVNYMNKALADGETQRFRIGDDGITLIETPGDAKICETDTLIDFLDYACRNTDADRYILVFWDHGEGTLGGFGRDELNENQALSVSELKTAVGAFGKTLDMIVFDACMMGTAEIAYALSGTAEYMIASEEITPTDGLYYTTWINALSDNPAMTNGELARMIVDSFVVRSSSDRDDVTMSVIRLDEADEFLNELEKLLGEAESSGRDIVSLAPKPYGTGQGNDQYDVIAVFENAGIDTSELRMALCDMIYYKRSVSDRYSGIAVYLPMERAEDYPSVRDELFAVGYSPGYAGLLDRIAEQ